MKTGQDHSQVYFLWGLWGDYHSYPLMIPKKENSIVFIMTKATFGDAHRRYLLMIVIQMHVQQS